MNNKLLWKKNLESFLSSIWIAILVMTFISFFVQAKAQDVYKTIPKNFLLVSSTVQEEQIKIFPHSPIPYYIGGLGEQESCITLTNSHCWNPNVELNTSRELGAGIFQLTKTYKLNGNIRFDMLGELKKQYPTQLSELNWSNIQSRPDLQIRSGLLLFKQNYDALYHVTDSYNRYAMSDSAYNGGLGNLIKARTACGLTKGCNNNLWFDNVENHLPQSRASLYGQQSAFSINQNHVKMVMKVRMNKYQPYLH